MCFKIKEAVKKIVNKCYLFNAEYGSLNMQKNMENRKIYANWASENLFFEIININTF